MSAIFGSGEYSYRIVDNWARLPEGWRLGDVAAVGVDASDQVYVFHRGEHPLIVFDRDGNYLRSWGEGCSGARTACTWGRTKPSI